MTTSTANFPELLWPGLLEIYGDTYDSWAALYDKIATVRKSTKAFEKIQGITGLRAAPAKTQGSALEYDDMLQGFQKEFVNITYGLGGTVTMEMWQDDQYDRINKLPAALARSFRETQEILVADQINSGYSTATTPQTTADGVANFSLSHLLVAGGTFKNTPTTASDLTQSALEQADIDISDYVNDKGYPIQCRPTTLIVPTALKHVAKKILETSYAVGSADNDVNTVKQLDLKLIINPYLTDPNAWTLLTSEAENGFIYMDRMKPEPDRDNVFDTKNLKFSTVGRFSVGAVDARGFYGSPGAS